MTYAAFSYLKQSNYTWHSVSRAICRDTDANLNPTNVHPDSSFELQKEDSMPGVVLCTLILGVLNISHYSAR